MGFEPMASRLKVDCTTAVLRVRTGSPGLDLNRRPLGCKPRTLPLSYGTMNWWSWTESNRRHSACKTDALPTELQPLQNWWPGDELNILRAPFHDAVLPMNYEANGGGRRSRTTDLSVTLVFKTSRQPLSGTLRLSGGWGGLRTPATFR